MDVIKQCFDPNGQRLVRGGRQKERNTARAVDLSEVLVNSRDCWWFVYFPPPRCAWQPPAERSTLVPLYFCTSAPLCRSISILHWRGAGGEWTHISNCSNCSVALISDAPIGPFAPTIAPPVAFVVGIRQNRPDSIRLHCRHLSGTISQLRSQTASLLPQSPTPRSMTMEQGPT